MRRTHGIPILAAIAVAAVATLAVAVPADFQCPFCVPAAAAAATPGVPAMTTSNWATEGSGPLTVPATT